MKTRTYLGKKRSGVVLSAFLALCILILATGCKKDETQIIPDIVSITAYANPKTVSKGQTSRITISVTGNPDSISGDLPERNSISGVFSTPPLNTTTTYHFVVYKDGRGCDIANVTIVVVPDPVPTLSVVWRYKGLALDSLPKGGGKVIFTVTSQYGETLTYNGKNVSLNGDFESDSISETTGCTFVLCSKYGDITKVVTVPVIHLTEIEKLFINHKHSPVSERYQRQSGEWIDVYVSNCEKQSVYLFNFSNKYIVDWGSCKTPSIQIFNLSLIHI